MIDFIKLDIERQKIEETTDAETLLNMGLMGRNYKKRPSDWQDFETDEQNLAFDMACSRQLIKFDERQDMKKAIETGREIG